MNPVGDAVVAEIEDLGSRMMAIGVGLALCRKLAAHQIREAAVLEAAKVERLRAQCAKSKQNDEKQAMALHLTIEVGQHRARYQAALQEWLKANIIIDQFIKSVVFHPVSQNQVTLPHEVAGGTRPRDPSDSPAPKDPSSHTDDETTQPAMLPPQ